ncbi:hypothetical protein BC629DRAFT_1290519, partial [Irpex lacteus]
ERLQNKWTATVYGFFDPDVTLVRNGKRYAHEFRCLGYGCSKKILRYLDTKDSTSTNNLRSHVKVCHGWGENILKEADLAGLSAKETRARVQSIPREGSITAAFARKDGKKPVTFSTRQLTRSETRFDRGFVRLMKTGRPQHWLPSPSTISRDTKRVFIRVRQRISNMLREYPGRLSFTADAWTSPNHRAFVAFLVHLEHDGKPLCFPLDVLEVPTSHSGPAMAQEFFQLLTEYGIAAKVRR